MFKIMKAFMKSFLVVLVVFSLLVSISVNSEIDPSLIQIGVVPPQDGYSEIMELAEDDINEYMKKEGLPYEFSFTIDHAEGQASIHLANIQQFKSLGIELIIGGGWSSQAQTALDYINENGVLLLSPSSTYALLAVPDDNLFRLSPSDHVQAPSIVDMLDSWGIKAIILLQRDDVWGDGLSTLLESELIEHDIELFTRIRYSPGSADYKTYLSSAEDAAVEAVHYYGEDHVAVQVFSFNEIVDIMKEAKKHPTIYGLTWFGSEGTAQSDEVLVNSPIEADHLKVYSTMAASEASEELSELRDRYFDETGRGLTYYLANWYDAAWIYALAVVETDSTQYDVIKEVLPNVASKYDGVSGNCSLNQDGDRKIVNFDIWGYGYKRKIPAAIKYGYIDGVTKEIAWYVDMPPGSKISCNLQETEIELGDSISVSGMITPVKYDSKVILSFYGPDESVLSEESMTDGDGQYEYIFTPGLIGQWKAKADWEGDEEHKSAVSSLIDFTVEKTSSTFYLEADKNEIKIGESLTIHGYVDPLVRDEKIVLYIDDQKEVLDYDTKTLEDGSFSFTITLPEVGSYDVYTYWGGNDTFSESTSVKLKLEVKPPSGELNVNVKDEEGRGLEDVIIKIVSMDGETIISGETDTQGSIQLSEVQVGGYSVQAINDGYDPEEIDLVVEQDKIQTITIVLKETLGDLEIIVTDEKGEAINMASVSTTEQPEVQSALSGTTNNEGKVKFEDIKPGEYSVNAEKDGYSQETKKAYVERDDVSSISIRIEKEKTQTGIPGFPVLSLMLGVLMVVFFLSTRKYSHFFIE
jgi:branched-chain amino acid transport system substrate-binding protein